MLKRSIVLATFVLVGCTFGFSQNIVGLPQLSQIDSTKFELVFKTDSTAIVTVHVAQDSTYQSAFIFLGRTIGEENEATIEFNRLRNYTSYLYRVYLGTSLSSVSVSFSTGSESKK